VTEQPPTARWLAAFAVYRDPRVVAILFLGFSSGLPLLQNSLPAARDLEGP
jgi:hypothetical protein